MSIIEVLVRRISVVSVRPFDDVVTRLLASIGQPDMREFRPALAATASLAELEALVESVIGASGLMLFARFDAGGVLHKELDGAGAKSLRLVVGNPIIMRAMASAVPDAASYAPVTILVDERSEGVRLSYDTMASLLGPYGSEAALVIARELDAKIETLIEAAVR